MQLTAPIKWHGGKHYLAQWILSHMPARAKNPNNPDPDDPGWVHYVECYAGGLAVLLAQDPEGISEVVADKNEPLMNFWGVLSSPTDFAEMHRILEAIPFCQCEYARAEFAWYGNEGESRADKAARFFIRCRQSMSGRMDAFAPLTRNRTRRGMNEQASAWLNAVEGLPAVHARLKRVVMIGGDAVEIIRQQDGPRTLFYLDPPYMKETRTAADVYAHEMTLEQHQALLECLTTIKGRFILSGYQSQLYDAYADLHLWKRVDREIDNKSSKGASKQKRTECLWFNY